MIKNLLRRNFLKKSMAIGAGSLFFKTGIHNLEAGDKVKSNNETMKTLNSLRTIHGNFTEQNIPENQIKQILKTSLQAANSSNMQTYSIIVVKDREKMRKVCGYSGSHMFLYCVDHNRLKACADHLGHPYHTDNITNFITGSVNASLVAQTAGIAAKSLGIDFLLTNGIHRGDMNRVYDILKLPKENCFPLIAMVLGYPSEEPEYKKGRLDGLGVIHDEEYHQLTKEDLDKIVDTYDDKSKHLGLHNKWQKDGHKHYLSWLFTAWLRRASKPTNKETQMFKLLKRTGYVELQKS